LNHTRFETGIVLTESIAASNWLLERLLLEDL